MALSRPLPPSVGSGAASAAMACARAIITIGGRPPGDGPRGATAPAFWLTDDAGTAHAYAGFNATGRDYARIGELYRNGGRANGKQIIPANWVRASITADAPHLRPGERANADSAFGYGYQWWLPGGGADSDFAAIGVYNQFVYVNPARRITIVKLSANSFYGTSNDESAGREGETIAFFRALARAM